MKKLLLFCSLVTIVFSANAQTAPNLGTAKTFGVLSGSTIAATDTITVLGNAGATTSVSARIKATTVYTGGTTVSAALTDLGAAKTNCSGQTATSISGTLGGQTLAHAVYSITGNATINDTLKLTGDTSSVFIFNISGNITIDTLSIISLGTVMPSKIFWNVSGTVTINHNANAYGMIMSGGNMNMNGIFSGKICLLSQSALSFSNPQSSFLPATRYGYSVCSSQKMTIKDYSDPCSETLTSCNLVTNNNFETIGISYPTCPGGTGYNGHM
jgi:hypothetical protein